MKIFGTGYKKILYLIFIIYYIKAHAHTTVYVYGKIY